MIDLVRAIATFVVAVGMGALAQAAAISQGSDPQAAGAVGTAVALATGLFLCQCDKKNAEKK